MRTILVVTLLTFLSTQTAFAEGVTNAITNQGGKSAPCDTTGNLAAGTFYQVSSDNAFQACAGEYSLTGDGDDSCDEDSAWTYVVHGHLTFAPPTSGATATTLEVKTYVGDDMILCQGGSSVMCSGNYKLLEDSVYDFASTYKSVPIDAVDVLLPAYLQYPNFDFAAFYVFAKPIGGNVQCTANNYVTKEHD